MKGIILAGGSGNSLVSNYGGHLKTVGSRL